MMTEFLISFPSSSLCSSSSIFSLIFQYFILNECSHAVIAMFNSLCNSKILLKVQQIFYFSLSLSLSISLPLSLQNIFSSMYFPYLHCLFNLTKFSFHLT